MPWRSSSPHLPAGYTVRLTGRAEFRMPAGHTRAPDEGRQATTLSGIQLVIAALGIFFALVACIVFPAFRTTILFLVVAGIVLLASFVVILLVLFNRGVQGPKPLSGTRCRECGKRRAMQEADRKFLHENVKVDFDHYKVIYRCANCGQQQEQEEHVFPNHPPD